MSEVAEGTVLANKYRVGRPLGEGGMATVYEGVHMRLGQQVAIKILDARRAVVRNERHRSPKGHSRTE